MHIYCERLMNEEIGKSWITQSVTQSLIANRVEDQLFYLLIWCETTINGPIKPNQDQMLTFEYYEIVNKVED